jgi:hypothetical protein
MAGSSVITPDAIEKALRGEVPDLGHAISAGELGERLGPHRRGRYPGQAFTRAAISLYKNHPEQQSDDFVEAWRSWFAAETTRQTQLRVRMNGMTADEMLQETGYVQQIGDDPVKALIAVGQLPPGTLLHVNGVAAAVECGAEIVRCECGTLFVKRSWNSRRCSECRAGARRAQPSVKDV